MSIYGDTTYNPFGPLPYGYNRNSNSSTTSTGNLWADDNVVWNLNDSSGLVQSLPETQSVMRAMGGSPSVFGGGYFNNLVTQQSGIPMSSNNGMGDILSLCMQMSAMNAQAKARKAQQAKLEEQQQAKEEAETISKKTKFDSTQLDDFISNENSSSVLEYGDFKAFASARYKELQEANDKKEVTLDAALESLGIESLSTKSKDKLIEELKKADTHDISKGLSEKQFSALLNKIGIDEDHDTISRQSFEDGIGKLRGGNLKPEDAKAKEEKEKTKAELLDDDFNELKNLVDKTSWNQELSKNDIEKIKEIIKKAADCGDKDTLKAFLDKLQSTKVNGENGTKTVLGSILAEMVESNDTGNDKEVLSDFEANILAPLKKASKEQGLNNEWNNTLDKFNGDELVHIKEKVNGWTGLTVMKPFTWMEKLSGSLTEWASSDVAQTNKMLQTARLASKTEPKPATETVVTPPVPAATEQTPPAAPPVAPPEVKPEHPAAKDTTKHGKHKHY